MVAIPRPLLCQGNLRVDVLPGVGPEWARCEQEILCSGGFLPLSHRIAWAQCHQPAERWFVAVRDNEDRCRAGFVAEVGRSRALPGHRILRVGRFGDAIPPGLRALCVEAVARLARHNPSVLRAHVEIFSPQDATREDFAEILRTGGFRRVQEPRSYTNTAVIDLAPGETDIFAAFPAKTRRDIRAVTKGPVEVRPIQDVTWEDRISELYRETMSRTGARAGARSWSSCIELSRRAPELSRLVGLWRTDRAGPESLLAFAWGCHHGDHAHYDAAASTRRTELKVPMAYALVWDLLRWAKREGATWFELGGITAGRLGSQDPLGGISDFKRYFAKQVVRVGDEWVLEAHWVRARLAGLISGCFSWIGNRA